LYKYNTVTLYCLFVLDIIFTISKEESITSITDTRTKVFCTYFVGAESRDTISDFQLLLYIIEIIRRCL